MVIILFSGGKKTSTEEEITRVRCETARGDVMKESAETIEEVWSGGEGEKKIFSPTRESRCRASGRTLAEKFGELLWIELRKRFCERRGGKWLRVTVRMELLELSDDFVRWGMERVEEERLRCFAEEMDSMR
jgi:hypothetical protein